MLASKRKARADQKTKKEADRASRLRVIEVDPGLPDEPDIDEKALRAELRVATAKQRLHDLAAPLIARYDQGESTTQIATATGLSPGYVYTLLKEHGAQFRSRADATSAAMKQWHESRKGAAWIFDSDEICQAYEQGASLASIAKRFSREAKTVRKVLTERGVRVRTAEEQWNLQFKKP